jgi:hypothetical protein
MVLAEGKFQIAELGDPAGVFNGLRILCEQFLHFFCGADIEVPGLIAHPLLVLHQLAGLDAQQHIMALRVLGSQIVTVVGTHQRDSGLLMEPQQALVYHCLIPDAVVL